MLTDLSPALAPLVDSRTGVIRALEPRTVPAHFPEPFALLHAVLSDSATFSPWRSDASGAGYAFGDREAMRGAAIGEAVERYCGNLVSGRLVRSTANDLRGVDHVSPEDLALPERSPFDSDTTTDWAVGRDAATDADVLVPASAVWVSYNLQAAPSLHPVMQAGLAAERSLDAAQFGGLREIVERDAMSRAWTGGGGVVSLTVPAWVDAFAAGPRRRIEPRWLLFPTDTGVPIVGALIRDTTTGYLTLGMGTAENPTAATLKALGEALQLQLFVADLDDENGPYARIAADPRSPLAPHRSDRRYARSYAADLSDVRDYGCHLQLHLDPGIQSTFLEELDASIVGRTALDALPPGPGLRGLIERFAALGERVITVDVTTDDVRPSGLRVVRMLVPGRVSNAPHAHPFVGGRRPIQPVPRPTPLPH
ncbi:YcaO-like family protein [Microbacterium sp. MM2322]|uniref:YcaO-like family protein n=1 Tax=Microbacterium sp. MM2322 TaxID=3157631 RepID=UPI0032D591DE